jgi:D-alanyl-lipoteichoic acid acyltransferase DltB (MBOAT superfamily)
MSFVSFTFIPFFLIVFALYWFVFKKNLRNQNLLLFVASYFFYGFWDWRFTLLLLSSTLLDYFLSHFIHNSRSESQRKNFFILSLIVNLGILGVFKYFDFFSASFAQLLGHFGWKVDPILLNLILPVGISFYTFHGISYIFDVYTRKISPEEDFVVYAVFVSFFPLLVAGPIERATHLLPQIQKPRKFDYLLAKEGIRQFLWGLFKKLVIANNCGFFANMIFDDVDNLSGSTYFLGAIFFSFQIYADFSGYSEMASGTAKLLGFNLIRNFAYPYFSKSLVEFWRRWHISLSSWFRDYLYIPMGGSDHGRLRRMFNVFFVFCISGLWHGASWHFVLWSLANWLLLTTEVFAGHFDIAMNKWVKNGFQQSLFDGFRMAKTFLLVSLIWIFFRIESITEIKLIFSEIFSLSFFTIPEFTYIENSFIVGVLVIFFLVIEWFGRYGDFALQNLLKGRSKVFRWSFYYFLILIMIYKSGNEQTFIYFQF